MWCYVKTGRRFPPIRLRFSPGPSPYPLGVLKVPSWEEGVLQTRQTLGLEVEPCNPLLDLRSGAHSNKQTNKQDIGCEAWTAIELNSCANIHVSKKCIIQQNSHFQSNKSISKGQSGKASWAGQCQKILSFNLHLNTNSQLYKITSFDFIHNQNSWFLLENKVYWNQELFQIDGRSIINP